MMRRHADTHAPGPGPTAWILRALGAAAVVAALAAGAASAWAGEPAPSTDEAQAREVAAQFQRLLLERLNAAMAAGGPVGAVQVCQVQAPAIAAQLSKDSGWQVKRVGTRVRNPATGTPDDWERDRLAEFGTRLANGVAPASLTTFAVVAGSGGKGPTQRYAQAIVVGPPCLACHGDPAAQSPELRQRLKQLYPADQAVGYRLGELRGAFSLQRPVR